jgi:hypothetical protein
MSAPTPAAHTGVRTDASHKWIAAILASLILASFATGVILYLNPEQRVQKLEQMRLRYEAKYHSRLIPPSRASEERR